MEINHTASATGSGAITAGDLVSFASQIPPQAEVTIKQQTQYQTKDGWSLSATWSDEVHKAWHGVQGPTITYPPGVRKLSLDPEVQRSRGDNSQYWGTGHP